MHVYEATSPAMSAARDVISRALSADSSNSSAGLPRSTDCVTAPFGTGDVNCLAGADTGGGPGALNRGRGTTTPINSVGAGVFAVDGQSAPSFTHSNVGFRAAR